MSDFQFRIRQVFLLLMWIGAIVYATAFAPPTQPDTLDVIQSLVLGRWSEINPLIVALFNVMGLWPVIYAAVALVDGRSAKEEGRSPSLPAWPFVVLSFGLGAFALLPYLALRQPQRHPQAQASDSAATLTLDGWAKWMESRWIGPFTLLVGGGFMVFGLLTGSWSEFVAEWQTNRFIHIMSLDFCALSVLFPLLLGDDMKRRGIESWWWIKVVAIAPLIGPAVYLAVRPSLSAEGLPTQSVAPKAMPTK